MSKITHTHSYCALFLIDYVVSHIGNDKVNSLSGWTLRHYYHYLYRCYSQRYSCDTDKTE